MIKKNVNSSIKQVREYFLINLKNHIKNLNSFKYHTSSWSRIKNVIKSKSLNSSWHGLPNIIRTQKLIIKLIWLFFLSIAFVGCSYFIIRSIVDYIYFESYSETNIKARKSLKFPAITFCNNQNIPLEKMHLESTFNRKIIDISEFIEFEVLSSDGNQYF